MSSLESGSYYGLDNDGYRRVFPLASLSCRMENKNPFSVLNKDFLGIPCELTSERVEAKKQSKTEQGK